MKRWLVRGLAAAAALAACALYLSHRAPAAPSADSREPLVPAAVRAVAPEPEQRPEERHFASIEGRDFPGSHPLTPERQAIQYENGLVGALYDALDARDARQLRELVARYREFDPDDEQRLQEGFELIADCLEQTDEGPARANALAYYERERASTIRRYVRRLCLEPE